MEADDSAEEHDRAGKIPAERNLAAFAGLFQTPRSWLFCPLTYILTQTLATCVLVLQYHFDHVGQHFISV